jgi:transcriptional regulator with GAF, ATPase, and Fis domain/tetratricopeptide (TPR) repeat protein
MAPPPLRPGLVLDGRFVLREALGAGQQGAVWAADDLRGDQPVALKVDADAGVLREASLLLRLSHPSLPRVLGCGPLPHGGAFVALERVEGDALSRSSAVATIVRAGAAVADALAHLHDLGLVHGDVKPAHIRLGPSGIKLLDLGLAGRMGHDAGVAGSLAFLAPEALAGERSAAGDLFALGVSLTLCLTGRHPWVDDLDDRRALLDAAATGAPPRDVVLDAVPHGLRASLRRALEPAASSRTSSARAWRAGWLRDAAEADLLPVKETLADGAAPGLEGLIQAPPWVGDPTVPARALEALEAALRGDGVGVAFVGPPGAGRGRLVSDTLRAARVRAAARGQTLHSADGVVSASPGPLVVTGREMSPEALAALHASALRLRDLAATPVGLCVSAASAPPEAGWTVVSVDPLTAEGLAALLGALSPAPLPPVATARWRAGTGGLAGRVVAAARALGAGRLATASSAEVEAAARPTTGLPAPEGLDAGATLLLGALLAADEPLPLRALLGLTDDVASLQALRDRGLVLGDAEALGTTVRCALPVSSEVLRRAYDHLAAALPERPSALARLAEAAGCAALARQHWSQVARGEGTQRPTYADRARATRAAHDPDPEAACWEAELWLRAGEPGRCLEAAGRAPRGARRSLLTALALRRAGRRDEAMALARAMSSDPHGDARSYGALVLARDALDRGDLSDAQRLLEAASPTDDDARARWEELSALVALGVDDLVRADSVATTLERRCLRRGDDDARARALSVLGMVAQRRGDPDRARRRYHDAWSLAVEAGDAHGASTYLVNLGGAALDAGDLGRALAAFAEAVPALAARGQLPELARALANLASLRAWVGDRVTARDLARRAARAADSLGDAVGRAFAESIDAECATDPDEAVEGLMASATRLAAAGDTQRSAEALSRAARRGLEAGLTRRAQEALQRARGLCAEPTGLAAVASVALALASSTDDAATASLGSLRDAAERALRDDPSTEAALWWSALRPGLLRALGDIADAAQARAQHRARVEALAATLPETEAGLFRETHGGGGGEIVRGANESVGARTAWRRLAEVTRDLHAEPRLDALLERIMDAVIELTGGRRGFLLLRGDDGALRVRTARNVARSDLKRDELAYSRSVAEEVARTGRRVVSVDAQGDGQLGGSESVTALQLRSVLAVPLRLPDEVLGTVYVDDRFRVGAFDDDAAEVAQAFADTAALALANARQRRALERALRRTERLSAELAHTVESQRAELAVARQATPDATRGRYDALIGRGAAMRKMLALLDRIAPSPMPVLLQGESGTGKELVARAIHANSPRAARPFVAENCSAIPESLLESVLFGHTRGAFTGADRARPGLFEVADGGTLFLDEVGEMSPAMQARLLRVLQEGEVRPVGGDRARKVDVRILAATHRDLAEMVRRGTFREDLYYRLAVVVVAIPTLRERREDIPALVAHFLNARAPGVSIDRRALARLVDAPWPGNIRQLQNEIARAAVLADGIIRVDDLSPAFLAAATERTDDAPTAQPLDLRHAVGGVERDLVERALRAHHGNQSRAARALGLSRFGLQKKLKRLGIDPRSAGDDEASKRGRDP